MDDLLRLWEESRERGEPVSVGSLCPDSPAEAAELERRTRLLESLDRILRIDGPSGPSPLPPPLPQRIGRYRVKRWLGSGANGIVYQAEDPTLRNIVAVKLFCPSLPVHGSTEAGWLARRFEQEGQLLAQLKHESIVRVHDAGLHEGTAYFVMNYVPGGTLKEHGKAMTEAGPRAVVRCLEQVARAVAYAHSRERPVLHRDLKPGNILLDADERPLVSDLGLAKLQDASEDAPAPTTVGAAGVLEGTVLNDNLTLVRTDSGIRPGTPPYLAPEQFDPAFGPIGPATDIWALGVILYELLTGVKPFAAPTRGQYQDQVCAGRFVRPRGVCPRLDPRLEQRFSCRTTRLLPPYKLRW
jgi:serine/threonine protein kinase